MYVSLHVTYRLLLSDFNDIFSTELKKKNSNIKYHENLSRGRGVVPQGRMDRRTDGRTGRHGEVNIRFSQVCQRA